MYREGISMNKTSEKINHISLLRIWRKKLSEVLNKKFLIFFLAEFQESLCFNPDYNSAIEHTLLYKNYSAKKLSLLSEPKKLKIQIKYNKQVLTTAVSLRMRLT